MIYNTRINDTTYNTSIKSMIQNTRIKIAIYYYTAEGNIKDISQGSMAALAGLASHIQPSQKAASRQASSS